MSVFMDKININQNQSLPEVKVNELVLEVLLLLLLLLGHVLVIVHRGQKKTRTEKKPGVEEKYIRRHSPNSISLYMISLGNLGEGKCHKNQEPHLSG